MLVGANRAPGRLMRCESKNPGGGEYWKVLMDSGEWLWPDGIILDTSAGPGAGVAVCEVCGARFTTQQRGDGLLCRRCNDETFGSAADHAIDAAGDRFRPRGNTTRWKPGRRR